MIPDLVFKEDIIDQIRDKFEIQGQQNYVKEVLKVFPKDFTFLTLPKFMSSPDLID